MTSKQGLSSLEAKQKLLKYGPNALPEGKRTPLWLRFFGQFNSPLIFILLFALIFDVSVWAYESFEGLPLESLTILFILLLNAVLGVWQETKSENALSRLQEMSAPHVWTFRDGSLISISVTEIVPGDLIRIETGERVPADGQLIETMSFAVDESVITGESIPLEKSSGDMLLSGSLAVRGNALLQVSATGRESNMGKLAGMLNRLDDSDTPLERRLKLFGKKIAIVVTLIALVVFGLGVLLDSGTGYTHILLFAVALAVAAVPESMPAVLTLALALGVERMASRKAVVRRLTAVEALGSVTVIATDKTGTLTENKMQVERLDVDDEDLALRAMVLANDADPEQSAGDPLDLGLLQFARGSGLDVVECRQSCHRTSQIPFDSQWKYMTVTIDAQTDDEYISYIKGAPDVILELCHLSAQERKGWHQKIENYNAEGYRTLALACSSDPLNEKLDTHNKDNIRWLGLVLLWDPPRQEIADAIASAQKAGIRVIMITGDHPSTALTIARKIGIHSEQVFTGKQLEATPIDEALDQASVFARVTPENKLDIVNALKERNEVVAVTGDGVNDAPALKAAHVGVAMGNRGSDVSREVADLVLLDDNFSTIVAAIQEGRSIYENIQKFIRTLFSTNLTEVLLIAVGAASAFYLGMVDGRLLLPLTAVQILWVNLLTDSLPALAITTDRNEGVMALPPRSPESPLLDQPTLRFVLGVGLLGGLVALALLWLLPLFELPFEQVQTTVFCYLVWVQISFVLPARKVRLGAISNPWVSLSLLFVSLLQLTVVMVPQFRGFLGIAELPIDIWLLLAGILFFSWAVAEGIAYWIRSSLVHKTEYKKHNTPF